MRVVVPKAGIPRQVRPGDVVVEIDGRTLRRRMKVRHPLGRVSGPSGPLGIWIENPTGSGVEWVIYPDTQVVESLTIERPDPDPAPEPLALRKINKRRWDSLPPVSLGFHRVPDARDGTRQVKCDLCGRVIPSLGIGYHCQRGDKQLGIRPCIERYGEI